MYGLNAVTKSNQKETPSSLFTIKAIVCLFLAVIGIVVGLPMLLASAKYRGVSQLVVMILMWLSGLVILISLENFLNFRFYVSELSDDEIDNEVAGITVAPSYGVQESYPELTSVRLNKYMTKKDKRKAADEIAVPLCFNIMFRVCLVLFAVCLAVWLVGLTSYGVGVIEIIREFWQLC